MKYNKIRLTRSEFDKLTTDEQCLFVLCCHLFHRIYILSNAIKATQSRTNNLEEKSAAGCQSSLLLKIHCGFLFEGWYSLKKLYFQTELQKKWTDRLPPEGKLAEKSLEDYFKKRSHIGEIRNHYSFHTDIEKLKQGIALFSKEDDLDILVPIEQGPVFCPVAEYMTSALFIKNIVDSHHNFDDWVENELIQKVTMPLSTFCNAMAVTLAEQGGATSIEQNIEIPSATTGELNLPFFLEF